MILRVLASSSKGNCYVLEGAESSILLECGIRFMEIKKGLEFDLGKISGCLLSHEHGDHIKSLHEVLAYGIPVYTSAGTAGTLQHHNLNLIQAKQPFEIGEFRILPFDTVHDAAEPLGFMIEQKTTGERLLFATDTHYIKYQFKGLNYLVVEANHSNAILDEKVQNGKLIPSLKRRIEKSHFSIENLTDFIHANDLSKVKKIILIHLSDSNSDAKAFRQHIQDITNRHTLIASPGMVVELKLYPF